MDLSFAEFATSSLKLHRIIVLGKKKLRNEKSPLRALKILKIGLSEI